MSVTWRLEDVNAAAYDSRLVDVPDCTLAYNRFARSAEAELDDPDGVVKSEYPRGTPVDLEVKRDIDSGYSTRFGGFVNGYEQGQNSTTLKLLSHDNWLRTREVYRSFGPQSDTAHLSFDGTDDNVKSSSTTGIPSGATGDTLSLSLWVNPDAVSGTSTLASIENEWVLRIEGGDIYFRLHGGNNGGAGVSLPTGEWSHIGIVWDVGTDITTYLNGEPVDTTPDTDTSADSGNALFLGARDSDANGAADQEYYDGALDDVQIFDALLSDADMQALFDGIGASVTPVTYYKLDSGSGSTAVDSAGSNDGTVNGATWVANSTSPVDRGVFKSVILRELVTDLTPLTWDSTRVSVYDDSRIASAWSGTPLDKVAEELASYSNREIFGATDSMVFFFEQRDSNRAPRDFTTGEYFDAKFSEDGSAELNEVTVYYGGNPASNAVNVADAEAQRALADDLGSSDPVVIADSKTFTEINSEQAARRKGRQILKGATAIQTGELKTWEGFDVDPGDLTRVVVPEQNVDDEFRVAEISHSWQEDTTTVKLAENSDGVVDTLVELSDEVSRVEARAADNNATITRFVPFDLPYEVAFTLNAYRRDVPADALIFGSNKGGFGDPDAGGGRLGDRRGSREKLL